ncbi:phosphoglycolate phosphatase [Vreelandella aquamarina]
MLKGKRLIAFDLDGTLIDSVLDLAVAVRRALDGLGLPEPSDALVKDWVGNGAPMLIERALRWATGSEPDAALNERAYQAFMQHYSDAPNQLTRLYPGAIDTLSAMRAAGMHLVLITNKPERFILPILQHFGMLDYFELCLGGDSLAHKKPHPLPLLHAASHFAVEPDACAMVGDSRHDVAAGKAAGFATFALPGGYNHGEPIALSKPDVLLDSLYQLAG